MSLVLDNIFKNEDAKVPTVPQQEVHKPNAGAKKMFKTRLAKFVATPEQIQVVTNQFRLHEVILDFADKDPRYLSQIPEERGVYFIAGKREEILLKVYVGRTKNFRNRLRDYHREFQVHSPNDRKMSFLQEWLKSGEEQVWQLRLYTLVVEEKEERAKKENKWIKVLKPLVNGTVRVEDRRYKDDVHAAFRNYFHAFFSSRQ